MKKVCNCSLLFVFIMEATARNFTVDTKGSCFMCLKCNSLEVSLYSFQRLSKYLQLNFKNVYNISLPLVSVSVFEDSEIIVSLCSDCSVEANKFVKLHKDLELIRKRVNTCIGRIQQRMVEADKDPARLQEHRDRITLTANPLELIQASIAENLRKETIKQCSILTGTSNITTITRDQPPNVSTITLESPKLLPSPVIAAPSPLSMIQPTISTAQNENAKVSSTTTILPARARAEPSKEVVVVDLDDSDEDVTDAGPGLVISSVSGASGTIFPVNSDDILHPSPHPITPTPTVDPSSSFSALQNFTADCGFDQQESEIIDNISRQTSVPAKLVAEDTLWKHFADGKVQCKQCEKWFDKKCAENITVHERLHSGVKPIACQHCNLKFRSAGNKRIHILTYHRKELFNQYRYPAVSNEAFQNAIDSIFQNVKKGDNNDSDKPYQCIYCPRLYRHKIDVEAHMINLHCAEIGSKLMEMQRLGVGDGVSLVNANTPAAVEGKKLFACNNCGIKFRHKLSLTKHLSKDNCSPPNKNKSKTLAGGEDSTRKNDDIQPGEGSGTKTTSYVIRWKCGICSVTFASQGDLKRHKTMKHGGTVTKTAAPTDSGAIYKCPYCGKKFKFYYSQRVHMLTLHRHQVFSKYAPEGAALSDIENGIQLILEKSKVTVDRTHSCRFCNRDFTGSVESILQNHILVSHFQEVVKKLKTAMEETSAKRSKGSSKPTDYVKVENVPEAVLPD